MNHFNFALAATFLAFSPFGHAQSAVKDCIMMNDGKVMVIKDGKTMKLEKEMTLENGTKVMPDGTVTPKNGKPVMIDETDLMTLDGIITKKDHLRMKDGRMTVIKGGTSKIMEKDTTLENGTRITMDGTVTTKEGNSMKMDATDMITLDGKMMKIPKTEPTGGPRSKDL